MRDLDLARLDETPLATIAPDEFAQYAIVVGVQRNPDPSSSRRLMVPPHHAEALEELREEIARVAHHFKRGMNAQAKADLEGRLLLGLMSVDLGDDAVCNRLPKGRPIILAQAAVADQWGRRALAESMQGAEVAAAVSRGDDVPLPIRQHFEARSRQALIPAHR
jgi:hypothetical protein